MHTLALCILILFLISKYLAAHNAVSYNEGEDQTDWENKVNTDAY